MRSILLTVMLICSVLFLFVSQINAAETTTSTTTDTPIEAEIPASSSSVNAADYGFTLSNERVSELQQFLRDSIHSDYAHVLEQVLKSDPILGNAAATSTTEKSESTQTASTSQ